MNKLRKERISIKRKYFVEVTAHLYANKFENLDHVYTFLEKRNLQKRGRRKDGEPGQTYFCRTERAICHI